MKLPWVCPRWRRPKGPAIEKRVESPGALKAKSTMLRNEAARLQIQMEAIDKMIEGCDMLIATGGADNLTAMLNGIEARSPSVEKESDRP